MGYNLRWRSSRREQCTAGRIPGPASKVLHAVIGKGDTPAMPPKGPRLAPRQVAMLKAWIDEGAKAPADEVEAAAEKTKHWAFLPPLRTELPAVRAKTSVRTPIDCF